MKRIICLISALCLVLGSFSFAFAATQDVSDAQTHTQLSNLYNLISGTNISGRLNTINNHLDDINANLLTLMGWLDPSTGGSTTALLNQILNALVYTNVGGATVSFLNDLRTENMIQSNMLTNLYNYGFVQDVAPVTISYGKDSTSIAVSSIVLPWNQSMLYSLNELRGSLARNYVWTNDKMYENAESNQTYTNWSTLNSSTFSAASGIDGIYKWLSNIQTPVARLSYVLASDERLEAQEAAAANEEAVVDNFIDSSGAGSASTSDIGSISDLSSGYKDNFGSDASVSGIFNIFNSNNMGWFSQETANQLDTTTPTRRGSSFDTPLLDQQINDIYDQIGVKHD